MASDEGERGLIEQQIEQWIRQNVAFPDKKLHGSCDHVIVRHVSVDRKFQGDVKSLSVRLDEGAEDEGVEPLLHKIAEAAQTDTDDLNQGMQSYAVCAYYPGDKNYVPRKYFRVAPSDVEIQRDLAPSEPPTEKGLTSQLMRHVEAIQRTATVTTGHLFQTMQAEMRRLAEMNEKFSGQQIDFLVLMQDLLDNSHGRRLKERSEEASLAMKESALTKLEALLPIFVNRLAGKPILPEEDRSLMLMATLLENLNDTQQANFLNSLTDAQKIAFAEILSVYEQRKSKWLEKEKKLINLGTQNELPPAQSNSSDAKSTSILAPVSTVQALPITLTLRERLQQSPNPSADPQIQQIEKDAQSFTNRFRDMLSKPTEGEKKP